MLISIPFLTMMERKAMGYTQLRKGPNKVRALGLLQPISDGGKLVLKEFGSPKLSNILLLWVSPTLSFILMVMAWVVYPRIGLTFRFRLGVVFFICISSMQVYTLLGSGWGSKSKYALIGSIRGAAQTISYEVCLIVLIFLPCVLQQRYNFSMFMDKVYPFFLIFLPMLVVWLVTCMAETNRAPFDFAEGERELVSGFNVEFSAFEFACLFLAEYGKILLMSFLTAILFFPSAKFSFILYGSFFTFCFVWARACFPRFRYDFLMNVAWKVFLPVSLCYLFIVLA